MSKRFFLLCATLLVLTGCWDLKEVEQQAYVIAIGLDNSEDSDNAIDVTFLISNPEFGTQQESTSTDLPTEQILTLKEADFISARDVADSVLPKATTYDMLEYIIVSEDLAKHKNFSRWIYDASKDSEIRRDIELLVSKQKAKDLFHKHKKSVLEPRPHKYWQLKIDQSANTGLAPSDSELLNYFRITEAGSDIFLSLYTDLLTEDSSSKKDSDTISKDKIDPRENKNRPQFIGSAVFKNGKMIGKLSGEETRLSLILNNTFPRKEFISNFKDPFNSKYNIAIKVTKFSKTKVNINLEKHPEQIHVEVPIYLDILTNHSMTNYRDKKNRKKLKTYLEKEFEKNMQKLVTKTQKEFKAQPFGWSLEARKQFLTIQQYNQFNWLKKYPNMDVDFNINVTIGEYGRQKSVPSYEEIHK